MYRWYEAASICIAYLSDVEDDSLDTEGGTSGYKPGGFSRSEWFRRGWTLQELLAPAEVLFYDSQWHLIGTKSELQAELEAVTRISSTYLRGRFRANPRPSVAQIMSWSASRNTTRVEDRAYSLMGLFNVNMALLYGEGRKAFLRLQLEILQMTDDESIFAWSLPNVDGLSRWGMLAPWPEAFAQSMHIERFASDRARPAFKMTNKGLKLSMPGLQSGLSSQQPTFDIILYCSTETDPANPIWGTRSPLIRLEWDGRNWQRIDFDVLPTVQSGGVLLAARSTAIYVKQPYLHMIRI